MNCDLSLESTRYRFLLGLKMTSSAKLRISGGFVAMFALGVLLPVGESGVAWATDECGADGVGASAVNCGGGAYAGGVTYNNSDGLTLTINDPSITVGPAAVGVTILSSVANINDLTINGVQFGTISTTGNTSAAIGLRTRNDGTAGHSFVILADGAIATSGHTAHGVMARIRNNANSDDAMVVINGGSIATSGDFSIGAHTSTDGFGKTEITLTDGLITTQGFWGQGLNAAITNASNSTTSKVSISGGTIITSGEFGVGASAFTGGLGSSIVALTGGTVTTNGNNAFGSTAYINNATNASTASITMSGGTVETKGDNAYGIYGFNAGVGTIDIVHSGGKISTEGVGAHAVHAHINNVNSTKAITINMTAGTVVANGDDAFGIFGLHIGKGATDISVLGSARLSATGVNSDGIRVDAVGGTHTISVSSDASVTGGSGLGAAIHSFSTGGGTIDIGMGAIIDGSASGIAIRNGDADGDGVDEIGGNTVITSTGTVFGDSILGLGNDIFNLTGGSNTGDIYGDDKVASATDGNDAFNWSGGALNSGFYGGNGSDTATISGTAIYDGTEVLDGGDDVSTGDGWTDTLIIQGKTATAAGASIINWENIILNGGVLTISDGALTTGFDANTGLTITNDGRLDAGNGFALAGNITTSFGGAFDITGGGAGIYLVSGNVTNNGVIRLQDSAAGDMLTVAGNYTGTGNLLVDTVLGDDSSVSDKLTINGNSSGKTSVIVNNVGGAGATTNRGILVVQIDGTSAIDAFSLGNGDYMLASGESVLIGGAYGYALRRGRDGNWYLQSSPNSASPFNGPLFQPASPVYEVYPQVLAAMNTMPTLQQRVGNRYWSGNGIKMPGATIGNRVDKKGAVWARVEGTHSHIKPGSTTRSNYDVEHWKMQAGLDGLIHENRLGRWIMGLTGEYGKADGAISSIFGNGSVKSTGGGMGLTTTWYGNNGFYLDGQARINWYTSDLSSAVLGRLIDNNHGNGYAFSLEAGKRFEVANSWTMTPQAQLIYSSVDFDAFTGSNGETISLEDGDSFKGRIGITIDQERNWAADSGATSRSHIYGIANLHYEFLDKNKVNVSGLSLTSEPDRLSGEIGLGASYNWADDKYSLYGEVSAVTSLENFAESYQYKGSVGLRVRF